MTWLTMRLKILWQLFWQLFLVPIFVCIWLFSLGSCGVELSFKNGTATKLRGWWRE